MVGSAASAQFGKLDERFKIQDQAKQAMKVRFGLKNARGHLTLHGSNSATTWVQAA